MLSSLLICDCGLHVILPAPLRLSLFLSPLSSLSLPPSLSPSLPLFSPPLVYVRDMGTVVPRGGQQWGRDNLGECGGSEGGG